MDQARITANLPSRSFDATLTFYEGLGFQLVWRSDGWMILGFGTTRIEFFPHPELDPKSSWFSACLRLPDIGTLHKAWRRQGIAADAAAIPRLTDIAPATASAPRMFYMVDPDGSLWRIIEDKDIR
ncbi:bleomycin resistance protein [Aliiroseovarius sp. S2029]|uniref:bleomycin resistance protein n=1 Tax=Aliiroseovarius sp. S2029 TaxID=2936988 RepID=UPI0020C1842E|nr:bleomycin resistance protein [Aliiroseovarius sp. S2029]MCK8482499.1 bleomycin resistance protein [Aliiroseovarius sp. S2029]